MKTFFSGLILVLISLTLYAQKRSPIKFGDVSMEDLKMVSYAKDTSASAVILTDYGESSLVYNSSEGNFDLVFERITRIKILKKDGLDWATFAIPLYKDGGTNEKLSSLKAVTYNLENNKVVETKLKGDAVFKEKATENLDIMKLTLPAVKVGSVIELAYRVNSGFLVHFQDWQFQSTIPTRWSEYRANIPEYFSYDRYTQGYIPLTIVEDEIATNSITSTTTRRGGSDFNAAGTQFDTDRTDFKETRYRWAAKEVPAFKPEPFITTSQDYILKINFELSHVQFPGRPVEPIIGSWEDLNTLFSESEYVGKEITGNGFLKKNVEEITAGLSEPEKKISAINSYVARTIEWNGNSQKSSSGSLKKVFEEKKGSSADINLLLGSMLEKAGFDVSPVLLSTRDHGFVRETIAISSQFNYVVCLVKLNDKPLLLDATDKFLPTGILPERCLNGNGFVLSRNGAFAWVPLKSPTKSRRFYNVDLAVNPAGELRGKVNIDQSGYYAQSVRKDFFGKGEEKYIKEIADDRSWVIEKKEFKNTKDVTEGFKESYDVVINDHVVATDGIIYINPFIAMQEKENPFKLEKREYPVDYGSPLDKMYLCKFTIPDGYVVDELPKSVVLKLPDNSARYSYNLVQTGNAVSLTSNLQINNSLFSQDEYPNLREFYTHVVAKQAEQIVLKKK